MKPQYIKFAEDIDFYEVFQKIEAQSENCFLLESLGTYSDQSRYSIIGFDPEQIISAKKTFLHVNEKKYFCQNPYDALRDIVPQDSLAREYAGGLIGYLAYDVINYFEPRLNVKIHDLFDQFRFGVYLDGLVYDKLTGELFYFFYKKNRLPEVKKMIQTSLKKSRLQVKYTGNTTTKEEHKERVEKIKDHIRAGDIFQAECGFKSEYEITGDTIQIYTKLRKLNPSPYMYYVKFGQQKIIGASPELLFRMRSGEMETFPLAGTVKRGKDEVEDMQLARKLLNDPKEIAEHNMLVDLHRNDIGRVAEFGTVKVRRLMDVKKFSHVQHISSEIVGQIKKGEDMFSALASNFPAGTLSGAPKIEAMKLIDRYEPLPRGPYGGGLGHFGFNGDCTFAIPIRTLFISGTYGYTQTSSGIVYDSVAEKEYEEIQNKLGAMKEVLTS